MRKSSKSANYHFLKGELEEYSTEKLHSHKEHQFLLVSSGISMLEEKILKKVQFGRMCAFIPAGVKHRTTVVGKKISYQSIYIDSFRLKVKEDRAIMFKMSSLSCS
ncbi:MAG TPA: hypothetical protein PLE16_10540, partial [Spirochaetota bacterium]|nr:hypothetical protein [Spirochaetota bacterium]